MSPPVGPVKRDMLVPYPFPDSATSITSVFTNNLSEFERVPGLLAENWVGTVA